MRAPHHRFVAPAGMTLLEVLVACGILVVGLASVAAILPAATSLLSEAATVDRASSLAANAAADLVGRGVLKVGLFPAGIKTLVIGNMFPNAPFNAAPFRKDSTLLATPAEAAYGNASYGATLAPFYSPPPGNRPGLPARLAVAVFTRSDPDCRELTLEAVGSPSSGVFRVTGTPAPVSVGELELARRKFLRGCSWVLAEKNGVVAWLHVGSSWATFVPNTRAEQIAASYASFTDPQAAAAVATGNTLRVFGFAGLVRLDERVVTLEP